MDTPTLALRHGFRSHLPALALFVALSLMLLFPMMSALATAIPGWEGDNLFYVRSLWWMKHALLDLHISPIFDPTSYFPVGQSLARSEMTAANTVLALPLTVAWGPVVSYNLVLFASFVATGWGTYFWVYQLSGRRSAGLVAGTIAAFLPLRFAHFPGHLPQMTTQWLPFTLYAIERLIERPTVRRGVLVGIFAGLIVLGCWYYGFASAIILPVYIVLRAPRALWKNADWWRGWSVATALALLLVLPFVIPQLRLADAGQLGRSLGELESWSLNVYDFFLPNLLHPVWGDRASAWFPRQRMLWVERGIALGYVACIAALSGLFWRRYRKLAVAIGLVWLVSYLIALGPTLHFAEHQVLVPVPSGLVGTADRILSGLGHALGPVQDQLRQTHRLPIPLPSLALYLFVPLAGSMRVMARFGVWTGFMTAALAGFGTIRLMEWGDRRWGAAARGAIPTALVGLIAFESLAVFAMMPVVPRPVDRWLASQPRAVVAELPLSQGQRAFQNYWATVQGQATVLSWNGDSFPPPEAASRAEKLRDFPSDASIAFLRSIGVTHVLVTPVLFPNWTQVQQVLDHHPLLTNAGVQGDVVVYRFHS